MRIAVVTTWFPTQDDPVRGVFVRRHLEAVAQRHDVEVVAVVPPGREALRGVPFPVTSVAARWPGPGGVASILPAVGAALHRLRPEVVHTMGFSSLAAGAPALWHRPWVHTEHWSGVVDPARAGGARRLASGSRHLLRLPDVVTVVSSFMLEAARPFLRPGRGVVVSNVMVGPASPPPPGPVGVRLLGVGAADEHKGVVVAVEALRDLVEAGEDASLRWLGAGPLLEAGRERARGHGLADRVELLGAVDPAQVGAHLGWCTAFLLPTRLETFCVSAAEALLHGRPVVVGAVGGQRDFVDESNGALVADRTPAAYAAAVRAVSARFAGRDPDLLAAPLRARFSAERVAADFDAVYRRAQELAPRSPA